MRNDSGIKTVKLVVMGLALVLVGWLLDGKEAGAYPAEQKSGDRPEIVGVGATMTERLGADDRPGLVVQFSGDIHGSLEPCG